MAIDTVLDDSMVDNAQSMSLPKNNTDYGKKTYWDHRFSTELEYEWLVPWKDVAYLLKPFLSPSSRILVVGCGNSSFSADLYDAGYKNVCSVDYSDVVINAMRSRNQEQRPDMEWMVCACLISFVEM
jgi:2-polyprenyl-3-methyl-5-hydroxy-6-metoxy-1,4-benzoquinol methylase